MAVPYLHLSPETRDNLGRQGMTALRQNLYAIDCQLCGAPLGDAAPAVRVVARRRVWAQAHLHHRDCGEPTWIDNDTDTCGVLQDQLSFHLQLVVFEQGPFAAKGKYVPILLLNPSMETAYLRREDKRWRVDVVSPYNEAYGFVRSGTDVGVPRMSSVELVSHGRGPNGKHNFVLHLGEQTMQSTMAPYLADTIYHYSGCVVAVTTAMDPLEFDNPDMRIATKFLELLDTGRCAIGWVPMVPTQITTRHSALESVRALCRNVFGRTARTRQR